MNSNQHPFDTNTVQKIIIIKQFIRLLISSGGLKTKINLLSDYIKIVKDTVVYLSAQINNINDQTIEAIQNYIILETERGYLFPTSFENLLLELIQILEYTIFTATTQYRNSFY